MIVMTREDAIKVSPITARVYVPCFRCGKVMGTAPRYLKKKTAERTLCLSCLNLERTPEIKAKIGAGVAKAYSTPEAKAMLSASVGKRIANGWMPVCNRPDREILKQRSEDLWQDPTYIANQAAGRAKTHFTDEFRAKMTEVQKRVWHKDTDLAKRHKKQMREMWKEEERLKIHRLRMSDPNYRKKVAINSVEMWTRAGYRDNMGEMARERWKTEEYRNKMNEYRKTCPKTSSLNRRTSEILTELGIEHSLEHQFGPYLFDVFIPSINTLSNLMGRTGIVCHERFAMINRKQHISNDSIRMLGWLLFGRMSSKIVGDSSSL